MLSNEEQTLFYRLAAFQGSRTIEAVESVCCFDLTLDVLNGLDSLCSKNLVQQEIGLDGESRFYLLETIHEYLIHRLRNSGEAEQIFQRHAKYFIELAENGKYPTRGGPEQITWLKRLEADHDNLRASRDWAISSGNMAEALRLVGSLDFFWLRMGSFDEGLNWVKASLEFIDEAPASVRASVYGAAGEILSFVDEDHDKSIEYYERAIDIYQKLGNKREIGWTSARVIYSYMMVSDIDAVQNYGKKSIKLLSEVGDNIGIAHALTIVGLHEYLSNQLIGAKTIFEEALSIARENHDRLRESISLLNLASVKFKEGDAKCANRLFKESLKVQIDIGHSRHSGTGLLSYLAGTAVALNQPRRAVKLLGAEENQYIRRGYNPQPHQSKMFQDYLSEAQLQLGSKAFEQAWSEGKAMSYDQAIAFALEISKIESFDVDPVTDPNIISGKDF